MTNMKTQITQKITQSKAVTYRAFCDGSQVGTKSVWAGVIVDDANRVVWHDVEPVHYKSRSTTVAEMNAALRVIKMAVTLRLKRLLLFSDCQAVVKACNDETFQFKSGNKEILNELLRKIRKLLGQLKVIEVRHKPRQGNKFADSLCRAYWRGYVIRHHNEPVNVKKPAVPNRDYKKPKKAQGVAKMRVATPIE